MSKNLYVCFDDSDYDPTYIGVDAALLVESDVDPDTGNPCARGFTLREVSVLPHSKDEIEIFASIMGWDVGVDNDGQIILYTGVQK